ncbi:hypothetical protein ABK040_008939 [Willaertia magna]
MGQGASVQFREFCDRNDSENCKKLLKEHSNELFKYIDSKDRNILMLATLSNADSIIKMMFEEFNLETKEIVNARDFFGNTALHWACYFNKLEIVKLLLAYGADRNLKNNEGETPIYLCNMNKRSGEVYDFLQETNSTIMKSIFGVFKGNKEDSIIQEKELEDEDFVEVFTTIKPPKNKENIEKQKSITKDQIISNITSTLCLTNNLNKTNEIKDIKEIISTQRMISLEDIKFISWISEGGEGKVLKGRWQYTDVAIKQIETPKFGLTFEMIDNLKLLLNISHPNCVIHHGYSFNEKENILNIVMELLDCSLKDFILQQLTLDLNLKLFILLEITKGMIYLHSIKPFPILHLDLKTENILLRLNNNNNILNIKICDFGLSQFKNTTSLLDDVIGTPRSIAPEILTKCLFSEKSDVFSFGILIYEVLFMRIAYKNEYNNMNDLLMDVANHQRRPTIPKDYKLFLLKDSDKDEKEGKKLDRLVLLMRHCWNEEPNERPTFKEIAEEIHQIINL